MQSVLGWFSGVALNLILTSAERVSYNAGIWSSFLENVAFDFLMVTLFSASCKIMRSCVK